MKGKTLALVLGIFLISQASATVFGTFQYSSTKSTSGGPVEYEVGMLNLGDEPLQVSVETSEAENISLNFEEEITLRPSAVSTNPGDGRWYYLGNGSYAEVEVYSFDAASRDFRNRSFQVTFSAYRTGNNSQGGFQNIVQERSYRFNLLNSSYREGLVEFSGGDEEESSEGDVENVTIGGQKDINSTDNNSENMERSGQGGLNPLLGLGALLSVAYLVKVMLL